MKSLGKNYIYNTVYQVLIILLPIITSPYASRVLGPEMLGVSFYSGANTYYFILLANLGFNLFGQRQIALSNSKQERSSVFGNVVASKVVIGIVSLTLFVAMMLFVDAKYKAAYFAQSLSIIAAVIDISWFFAGIEDFKKIVIRNLVTRIIFVIALFILVKGPQDIYMYILIMSGGTFIGNVTLWGLATRQITFERIRVDDVKTYIVQSFVLFIPTVAINVYVTLNQTLIGLLDSTKNVGFFAQSDNIIKVLLAVVTSLGTVMIPRMTKLLSTEKTKEEAMKLLNLSFKFMTTLSVPLVFGVMSAASRFAVFFYGNKFAEVGQLMLIEAINILFIAWSNVIGVQYLIPSSKMKQYTFSVTAGAVFNVLVNPLLILGWGVKGAMVTLVLTEMIVFAVQLLTVKAELELGALFAEVWKPIMAGAAMFIVLKILFSTLSVGSDFAYLILNVVVGALVYVTLLIAFRASYLKKLVDFIPLLHR